MWRLCSVVSVMANSSFGWEGRRPVFFLASKYHLLSYYHEIHTTWKTHPNPERQKGFCTQSFCLHNWPNNMQHSHMSVSWFQHPLVWVGISFIGLTGNFIKSRIIYEGGLVWHDRHSLWDRSSEWFLAATAMTRPHCLWLLDLGFYSPMITGSCYNVRLSVAKLFSTR